MTDVRADFTALAAKADLAALEARMTWRIVGLVIVANAVPVATMRFLP